MSLSLTVCSDNSPVSNELSEFSLIGDLLYMLLGSDGEYLAWNPSLQQLTVKPSHKRISLLHYSCDAAPQRCHSVLCAGQPRIGTVPVRHRVPAHQIVHRSRDQQPRHRRGVSGILRGSRRALVVIREPGRIATGSSRRHNSNRSMIASTGSIHQLGRSEGSTRQQHATPPDALDTDDIAAEAARADADALLPREHPRQGRRSARRPTGISGQLISLLLGAGVICRCSSTGTFRTAIQTRSS